MTAWRFAVRSLPSLLALVILMSLPGWPQAQVRPAPEADPYSYLTAGALKAIRPLPETVRIRPTGRIREFTLDIRPGSWEPVAGVKAEAITVNGTVPGPLIRVTEGDTVRITVKNNLPEPTAIHWHGLHVPNAMDGVTAVTQDPIPPQGSFTYEFLASHAGTFMYHSHFLEREIEQIDRGLYGLFIVDPQDPKGQPKFDREFTMLLSAWIIPGAGSQGAPAEKKEEHGGMAMAPGPAMEAYNFWTINGKAFPDLPEWRVKRGEVVRARIANVSNFTHPMHLHGHDFVVLAKDGEPLRSPQAMNTLSVNAGETYDIAFVANNPGAWVFHCHELHHTMNGMTAPGGLIQLIRYEGTPALPAGAPRPSGAGPGKGH